MRGRRKTKDPNDEGHDRGRSCNRDRQATTEKSRSKSVAGEDVYSPKERGRAVGRNTKKASRSKSLDRYSQDVDRDVQLGYESDHSSSYLGKRRSGLPRSVRDRNKGVREHDPSPDKVYALKSASNWTTLSKYMPSKYMSKAEKKMVATEVPSVQEWDSEDCYVVEMVSKPAVVVDGSIVNRSSASSNPRKSIVLPQPHAGPVSNDKPQARHRATATKFSNVAHPVFEESQPSIVIKSANYSCEFCEESFYSCEDLENHCMKHFTILSKLHAYLEKLRAKFKPATQRTEGILSKSSSSSSSSNDLFDRGYVEENAKPVSLVLEHEKRKSTSRKRRVSFSEDSIDTVEDMDIQNASLESDEDHVFTEATSDKQDEHHSNFDAYLRIHEKVEQVRQSRSRARRKKLDIKHDTDVQESLQTVDNHPKADAYEQVAEVNTHIAHKKRKASKTMTAARSDCSDHQDQNKVRNENYEGQESLINVNSHLETEMNEQAVVIDTNSAQKTKKPSKSKARSNHSELLETRKENFKVPEKQGKIKKKEQGTSVKAKGSKKVRKPTKVKKAKSIFLDVNQEDAETREMIFEAVGDLNEILEQHQTIEDISKVQDEPKKPRIDKRIDKNLDDLCENQHQTIEEKTKVQDESKKPGIDKRIDKNLDDLCKNQHQTIKEKTKVQDEPKKRRSDENLVQQCKRQSLRICLKKLHPTDYRTYIHDVLGSVSSDSSSTTPDLSDILDQSTASETTQTSDLEEEIPSQPSKDTSSVKLPEMEYPVLSGLLHSPTMSANLSKLSELDTKEKQDKVSMRSTSETVITENSIETATQHLDQKTKSSDLNVRRLSKAGKSERRSKKRQREDSGDKSVRSGVKVIKVTPVMPETHKVTSGTAIEQISGRTALVKDVQYFVVESEPDSDNDSSRMDTNSESIGVMKKLDTTSNLVVSNCDTKNTVNGAVDSKNKNSSGKKSRSKERSKSDKVKERKPRKPKQHSPRTNFKATDKEHTGNAVKEQFLKEHLIRSVDYVSNTADPELPSETHQGARVDEVLSSKALAQVTNDSVSLNDEQDTVQKIKQPNEKGKVKTKTPAVKKRSDNSFDRDKLLSKQKSQLEMEESSCEPNCYGVSTEDTKQNEKYAFSSVPIVQTRKSPNNIGTSKSEKVDSKKRSYNLSDSSSESDEDVLKDKRKSPSKTREAKTEKKVVNLKSYNLSDRSSESDKLLKPTILFDNESSKLSSKLAATVSSDRLGNNYDNATSSFLSLMAKQGMDIVETSPSPKAIFEEEEGTEETSLPDETDIKQEVLRKQSLGDNENRNFEPGSDESLPLIYKCMVLLKDNDTCLDYLDNDEADIDETDSGENFNFKFREDHKAKTKPIWRLSVNSAKKGKKGLDLVSLNNTQPMDNSPNNLPENTKERDEGLKVKINKPDSSQSEILMPQDTSNAVDIEAFPGTDSEKAVDQGGLVGSLTSVPTLSTDKLITGLTSEENFMDTDVQMLALPDNSHSADMFNHSTSDTFNHSTSSNDLDSSNSNLSESTPKKSQSSRGKLLHQCEVCRMRYRSLASLKFHAMQQLHPNKCLELENEQTISHDETMNEDVKVQLDQTKNARDHEKTIDDSKQKPDKKQDKGINEGLPRVNFVKTLVDKTCKQDQIASFEQVDMFNEELPRGNTVQGTNKKNKGHEKEFCNESISVLASDEKTNNIPTEHEQGVDFDASKKKCDENLSDSDSDQHEIVSVNQLKKKVTVEESDVEPGEECERESENDGDKEVCVADKVFDSSGWPKGQSFDWPFGQPEESNTLSGTHAYDSKDNFKVLKGENEMKIVLKKVQMDSFSGEDVELSFNGSSVSPKKLKASPEKKKHSKTHAVSVRREENVKEKTSSILKQHVASEHQNDSKVDFSKDIQSELLGSTDAEITSKDNTGRNLKKVKVAKAKNRDEKKSEDKKSEERSSKQEKDSKHQRGSKHEKDLKQKQRRSEVTDFEKAITHNDIAKKSKTKKSSGKAKEKILSRQLSSETTTSHDSDKELVLKKKKPRQNVIVENKPFNNSKTAERIYIQHQREAERQKYGDDLIQEITTKKTTPNTLPPLSDLLEPKSKVMLSASLPETKNTQTSAKSLKSDLASIGIMAKKPNPKLKDIMNFSFNKPFEMMSSSGDQFFSSEPFAKKIPKLTQQDFNGTESHREPEFNFDSTLHKSPLDSCYVDQQNKSFQNINPNLSSSDYMPERLNQTFPSRTSFSFMDKQAPDLVMSGRNNTSNAHSTAISNPEALLDKFHSDRFVSEQSKSRFHNAEDSGSQDKWTNLRGSWDRQACKLAGSDGRGQKPRRQLPRYPIPDQDSFIAEQSKTKDVPDASDSSLGSLRSVDVSMNELDWSNIDSYLAANSSKQSAANSSTQSAASVSTDTLNQSLGSVLNQSTRGNSLNQSAASVLNQSTTDNSLNHSSASLLNQSTRGNSPNQSVTSVINLSMTGNSLDHSMGPVKGALEKLDISVDSSKNTSRNVKLKQSSEKSDTCDKADTNISFPIDEEMDYSGNLDYTGTFKSYSDLGEISDSDTYDNILLQDQPVRRPEASINEHFETGENLDDFTQTSMDDYALSNEPFETAEYNNVFSNEPYEAAEDNIEFSNEPFKTAEDNNYFTNEPYESTEDNNELTNEPFATEEDNNESTNEPFETAEENNESTNEPCETAEDNEFSNKSCETSLNDHEFTKEPFETAEASDSSNEPFETVEDNNEETKECSLAEEVASISDSLIYSPEKSIKIKESESIKNEESEIIKTEESEIIKTEESESIKNEESEESAAREMMLDYNEEDVLDLYADDEDALFLETASPLSEEETNKQEVQPRSESRGSQTSTVASVKDMVVESLSSPSHSNPTTIEIQPDKQVGELESPSGPQVRKGPPTNRWMPGGFCYNYLNNRPCSNKPCQYKHEEPDEELLVSRLPLLRAAYKSGNFTQSLHMIDSHVVIANHVSREDVYALFALCIQARHRDGVTMLLKLMFRRELVTQKEIDEWIHLCIGERNSGPESLEICRMVRSRDIRPSPRAGIMLLKLTMEEQRWNTFWPWFVCLTKQDGFEVPLELARAALMKTVGNPCSFTILEHVAAWLQGADQALLGSLDTQLLQRLCGMLGQHKKFNRVATSLQFLICSQDSLPRQQQQQQQQHVAKATLSIGQHGQQQQHDSKMTSSLGPYSQELATQLLDDAMRSCERRKDLEPSPSKDEAEVKSWIHRVQSSSLTQAWDYLADLYVDMCVRQCCRLDGRLVKHVLQALLRDPTVAAPAYRDLLFHVIKIHMKNKQENPGAFLDIGSLSDVGNELLLLCHKNGNWSGGSTVLTAMFEYRIVNLHPAGPRWEGLVPIALETAIKVGNWKSALHVLQATDLSRLGVPAQQCLLGLFPGLIDLLKQFGMLDNCYKILEVAYMLIHAGHTPLVYDKSKFSLKVISLDLIRSCFEAQELSLAVKVFQLVSRHPATFFVAPVVKRHILIAMVKTCCHKDEINALVEDLKRLRAYPVQNFKMPRKIMLPGCLSGTEAFILIQDYLLGLYNLLCKQIMENDMPGQQDLNLTVCIEPRGDVPKHRMMVVLKEEEVSPPLVHTILRQNFQPPLQNRYNKNTSTITIDPNHLQDYLQRLDETCCRQGLVFQRKLQDRLGTRGGSNRR